MLVKGAARRAEQQRRQLSACAALLLTLQQQRQLRQSNKHRGRLDWEAHVHTIGDIVFKSAYRLSLAAFNTLLNKILPQ